MKILLINGSPRLNGCTSYCIKYLSELLNNDEIDTEILNIPQSITHCNNCRLCKSSKSVCQKDDFIKLTIDKLSKCNGLIIGSPVYYYSVTSQLQAFITRLCYSSPKVLNGKLCSFFSVSRRTGNTNCFDQMMKVFQMHNAIMIGGNYVNEIYGDNPNELQYDKEGMLSLKYIAKNMSKMGQVIDKINLYSKEKIHTNFISREFLSYINKMNHE